MNEATSRIGKAIEPFRQQIIHHKVYQAIQCIEDLQVFMQYHIYAVWDFMSLLKALQNNLTCTSVPWFPKGNAVTRHLINEIVLGEEADVDQQGNYKSHFELYIEAMNACGADTESIDTFIQQLIKTGDLQASFNMANVPAAARRFVGYSFKIIDSNKTHLQSAIFTFGREDLIPQMFLSIINDLYAASSNKVSIFKYYLERHIEVDGDHHSQLALQMTANLCGDNEMFWQEAETAVIECLQQRIHLWDGAYEAIMASRKLATMV